VPRRCTRCRYIFPYFPSVAQSALRRKPFPRSDTIGERQTGQTNAREIARYSVRRSIVPRRAISGINRCLYVRKGPRAEWLRLKGCRAGSRVSRRNADLKYARNARESESRYSIIVGLPHLHLHSGLPRCDNPPLRARKDEPTTATSNFPVGVIAREESDYAIVCSDSSTETDRMTRLERVIERERNLRTQR